MSDDVTLASIELQLFSHGQLIEKLVTKVDDIGGIVLSMRTEMDHLVTKESCAEGRKDLSDDLKARMDGDREITGMNITLPALLQKYSRTDRPTPVVPPGSSATTRPSGHPREPKTAIYYIKAVSAIVSLTFALFTMTFFAYRMMDRMDQQQRLMQTLQQEVLQMDGGHELDRPRQQPVSIQVPQPMSIQEQVATPAPAKKIRPRPVDGH